jgi:hypothetical protein
MAAELPRPGVEVIQVFRSVSPSIITPQLMPNVVGVAKQVVGLNASSGTGGTVLNPDALVQLPAFFVAKAATGSPAVYGGLDGLLLDVSINNGTTISVVFADATATGITPASMVAQIAASFKTQGVTAALAELVGDGLTQWQLRTIGVGSFQTIKILSTTSAAVATALGIGLGQTYSGIGSYNQYIVDIPGANFPDPRKNLRELGIELDSIRVFLSLGNGTGVREALRDTAFLRNGLVNDPAVVTGTVDLTGLVLPGALDTLTILLKVDGGAGQTVTFAAPANAAAVLSQINSQTTGLVATAAPTTNFLVLTSDSVGADASIQITGGTGLVAIGLVVGTTVGFNISVIDDGDGDTLSSLIKFTGETFTTSPTAAVVTASAAATTPAAGTTLTLSDGKQPQTIVFDGVAGISSTISQINAVVGTAAGGLTTASDAGGGILRLTHTELGTDSVFRIIGGTALGNLDPGVTPTLAVGYYRGIVSKPEPGDELWIDGVFFANVVQVAPGAVANVLKVDKLVPVSTDVGSSFYIIAKGLDTTADPNRPNPDLKVTTAGSALLKQEQLRDTQGDRIDVTAPMYVTYSAVRKDVTAVAEEPGLLIFDDVTQLGDALSPLDATNPLGLGLFFAIMNATGVQVTGLGVDAVSADEPFGTVEAFTRAAEFLEGQEIYATTPLTHNTSVHQVWKAHAETMSAPEQKGERIAIINQPIPTTKLDTLVASGTNGNTSGPGGLAFDTGVANLTALILNAGISPVGTIAVSKGLFLDIASDAKHYSIASVSGSVVTIRTTFAAGENDDSFYSTTALTDPTIMEAFSVRVRGVPLVTSTGAPDNQGIAETIAATGRTFQNRRLWMVAPDKCAATVNGLETLLEGFYMTAGIVGMIGAQPPQQSFTNFPMTGYTRVIGSNDRFSERQLNIMAGGGAYIIVQDAPSAPLISRFALTTDLTSVETRTDSVNKVVDFTAKLLRRALRNYIGRFNISQAFLDSLGSVISGIGGFLIEAGVLIGFNLNNIVQDEDSPDTVLVDVTLDVPYPCNFIRLTLVI